MQVVILAGGLGTRLGSLTENLPKPMMPVKGKPFLEWQFKYFSSQGCSRFLLLTGYQSEKIKKFFGEGKKLNIEIDYAHEELPLGTGGALLAARDKLDEHFILMFGDSFLPIQVSLVSEKLRSGPHCDAVMTVYNNREDTSVPFNVYCHDGLVLNYDKSPTPEKQKTLNFVEAGVYGIRRSMLDRESLRKCSFETEILPKAIARKRVLSLESQNRFFDIGTPQRLSFFESRIGDYFSDAF
jgi:NDP-sugar pyrophosphorylase family protein